MPQSTPTGLGTFALVSNPKRIPPYGRRAGLREALKRCSASTYWAAVRFHRTGNPAYLPAIVHGVIERYVDGDLRARLQSGDENGLRLREDLGIDSLTMMEILIVAEEVLQVSIDNAELSMLRTVGEMKAFVLQVVQHGTGRR